MAEGDSSQSGHAVVNLKESKNALEALKGLSATGELQGAEECILEYAQGVTDEALTCLSGCTRLTHLNLNACQDYSDSGLEKLAETCTGLVNLSLYWNVHIGDRGIGAMSGANPSLTNLNLSGCKGLSDAGLSTVARSSTMITNLDLTRCCLLTNPGLVTLAECCPEIRDLRFYACGYIGNEGVGALIKNLRHMVVLDLCGSKEITDEVTLSSSSPPHHHLLLPSFLSPLSSCRTISMQAWLEFALRMRLEKVGRGNRWIGCQSRRSRCACSEPWPPN